ncbi:MAG: hypothetical protein HY808_10780 [Nitrospirae bacterium]|nr:hypothetical protein [Nitrospirota bacterium]
MNKTCGHHSTSQDTEKKSKIKNFFEQQANKLKLRKFTCPICKEVFHGLSKMSAHLKKHCT